MSIFGVYASYYDALYRDKDYEAECDFLEQIFARYAHAPVRTILDLGCGTGGHALPLARRGYTVTGVDLSEHMLEKARQKAADAGLNIRFHQGDIRNIELRRAFDAVIAMFAVISYQITNEDLAAAFRTARRHLEPGGLFVFDCWFGPAVLVQRPTDRYKVVERNGERIIRFAHPTLDIMRHTVQVDYKVLRLKDDRVLDEGDESHVMRFLFPQEIAHYLGEAGFRLEKLCPFMALERDMSEQDWNVSVISKAM
jgi:SAM-dependent methyltransferase